MKKLLSILIIVALMAFALVSCKIDSHQLTKIDAKAATCETAGVEEYYTCSHCDKLFADAEGKTEIDAPKEIKALGHSFTGYESNNNATCTADGTKTAKCDRCDATDTVADEGSKLSHSYVVNNVSDDALKSAADCDNAAVYYKSCACGAVGNSETFESGVALGHDYTEKVADEAHLKTKGADCQTKDTYWYDCVRCASISDKLFFEGESVGKHNVSSDWATKDGKHFHECTVDGCDYTEGDAACSDVLTDSDHKCDVCSADDVTSHVYSAWVNAGESHEKTCNCGDKVTEAHVWGDGVVTSNPTHTATGVKTYTCECSATKTEILDKLVDHNYNQEKVEEKYLKSEATCESAAVYYKSCVCGEFSTDAETFKSGDPIAHSFVNENTELEGALKSAATCDNAAVYYKSCVCGAIGSDTFVSGSALGHNYGEASYVWSKNNATCTATIVCGNDENHVVTETVDSVVNVIKAASCEEAGNTQYTATFVNSAFAEQSKDVTVNAFGHTYGKESYVWSDDNATCTASAACVRVASHVITETVNSVANVTKAATCEEAGITQYTATFTNSEFAAQFKDVVIEATGHNEVVVPAVAPVMNNTGLTEGTKCSNCDKVFVAQQIVHVAVDSASTFVVEAEALDITNLTPSAGQSAVKVETPGGNGPLTSRGKSIGCAGGGYTTITIVLNDKATVQVYGRLAIAEGGDASKLLSIAFGDKTLAASGTLPKGSGSQPYWQWEYIPFGSTLDLEAGTYTFTVNFLSNPNVDCFKFKALSYGEFFTAESPDAEISIDDESVSINATDFDNFGVISKNDFVNANRLQNGKYFSESGNGENCICGFDKDTFFKLNLSANAAMRVEMLLVGAASNSYDISTGFTLAVNGETITIPAGQNLMGSGSQPYWDWQTVSFGQFDLVEGNNEITLTVKGQPNIVRVIFKPVLVCTSLCEECGLCTAASCVEEGHENKCINHDAYIAESTTSVKVEAEDLSLSHLIGDSVGVKKENFTNNGATLAGLGHIAAGGYQTFTVLTTKNVNVALKISIANCNGGNILTLIPKAYINGQQITLTDAEIPKGVGSSSTPDTFYWNISNIQIATIALEANCAYEFKIYVNGGNFDGYVLEIVDEEGQTVPNADQDVVISGDAGATRMEMETLDLSDSVINSHDGAIGQIYEGQVGGSMDSKIGMKDRLYWFDPGTKFVVHIKVEKACTFDIALVGWGGAALNTYNYYFDGEKVDCTATAGLAKETGTSIGTFTVDAPGVYVLELEMYSCDFDAIIFTVAE